MKKIFFIITFLLLTNFSYALVTTQTCTDKSFKCGVQRILEEMGFAQKIAPNSKVAQVWK